MFVLDIETIYLAEEVKSAKPVEEQRVSVCCVKDLITDYTTVYTENSLEKTKSLEDLRDFLIECMENNLLIIGHNTSNFDLPIIYYDLHDRGMLDGISYADIQTIPMVDTLTHIWRQTNKHEKGVTGLDDIMMYLYGIGKNAHSASAPKLWRRGEFKEVIDYCKNDVDLSALLFMHGVMKKEIKLNNGKKINTRKFGIYFDTYAYSYSKYMNTDNDANQRACLERYETIMNELSKHKTKNSCPMCGYDPEDERTWMCASTDWYASWHKHTLPKNCYMSRPYSIEERSGEYILLKATSVNKPKRIRDSEMSRISNLLRQMGVTRYPRFIRFVKLDRDMVKCRVEEYDFSPDGEMKFMREAITTWDEVALFAIDFVWRW